MRVLRCGRVVVVVLAALAAASGQPRAVSPDIVISQVYGGGGNTGATYTHDFVELHNRGAVAVTITGWTVQYASSAGTTWQTTTVGGSIPPGGYYLVQQAQGAGGSTPLPAPDAAGTIAMSGTSGKVALVRDGTMLSGSCPASPQIADLVGYGTANCFEGSGAAPGLSNTTAAIRAGSGSTDTDVNAADFSAGPPAPRNSASPPFFPGTPTNPTATGQAAPSSVSNGGSSLFTVTVTPGANPASTGITVTADLSSIGGSATQAFFDDGTNGDATAGDAIFSFSAIVTGLPGAKSLPVAVADAQNRTGSTSIAVTIVAPATGIVISQVYGGGGNSGAIYTHDFIELFNRGGSAVNLAGWSVQYASSTGSTWQVTPLSGTMPPGSYLLIQEAQGSGGTTPLPAPDVIGTIPMSATSGKIALVTSTTALSGTCPTAGVQDQVGYGSANCFEGSGPAPGLSNTTAALRLGDGSVDSDDNAADFAAGAPAPRSSVGIPPTGTATATPAAVDSGDFTLLTVSVNPGQVPPSTGLQVTADLSSVGGAAAQPLFDDGTNGDAAAGDLIFSFLTTVTGAPGARSLPVLIADAQGRSTSTAIQLAIEHPPTAIHAIQGTGTVSPFAGQVVTTRGIVTALRSNGFYIQTPDALADGDALTSEGILVFTGSTPPATLARGDDVRVTGTVVEFRPSADPASPPLTEIGGSPLVAVMTSGNALPAPVVLLSSFTTTTGDFEQLERFEGMRVMADLEVVAPTQAFSRNLSEEASGVSAPNGNFYAVLRGLARPLREPGFDGDVLPAGAPCCVPLFDRNPERLRVTSTSQPGAVRLDVVAGQALNGITGVLDYSFRTYTLLPDPLPWAAAGNDAAVPVPAPGEGEFTIGAFNMERFFDTVDAPGVDDVVMTAAGYERRLRKASLTVREVLRSPDILGVSEVESLQALQDIAARVNADSVAGGDADPGYVAYLEEGNDPGGIDVGFLVKSSRVQVVSVTQVGKDTTWTQPDGAVAILNDRPPLVLEATINGPIGMPYPVTVIANHLRSLSGITGADGERVRAKRATQAEFLADYIQSRQAANPGERIVAIGDFNAFQFSDGLVDVVGTVKGAPAPANQVVLASADHVTPDLANLIDGLPADQQYSFVFDGNAQAIDHLLVNEAAGRRVSSVHVARSNADFPESLRADETRPERLSDHDAPVAYFAFPGAPIVTLHGSAHVIVEAFTDFSDPGAAAHDDDGPLAVEVTGGVDVNVPGVYTIGYTATNGYLSTTVTRTVQVIDTIAPSIEEFRVTPSSLGPPNHALVDVAVPYSASDASGNVTCELSVTSNEAANATGDGNTEVDWIVTGLHGVRLRAERSGRGTGRIYTVMAACRDASGNQAARTGFVTVPR